MVREAGWVVWGACSLTLTHSHPLLGWLLDPGQAQPQGLEARLGASSCCCCLSCFSCQWLVPSTAPACRLADDEARHLEWCLQRMEELGYEYGCMPAHNLL